MGVVREMRGTRKRWDRKKDNGRNIERGRDIENVDGMRGRGVERVHW